MKANQQDAVARLRTLYDKRGEDQVFAHMAVRPPADMLDRVQRRASRLCLDAFPAVEDLFPLWEDCLSVFDPIEDDWLPALYPRQYDQGIYGTLFGARMVLDPVDGAGWVSSMSRALDGKTYPELLALAANPNLEWAQRMEADLRWLAARSRGRWGVGVAITVDGFNLAMQIRGNQTMLDVYDCPDQLKAFLQAGVDLNIKLVERQRAAIDTTFAGGVYDFANGGWMPAQSIPMSVDCYNMCRAEVYAEFGRPYQQQLIDHFGGGNFHVHGNGRHLLPEVAKLDGLVVASIGDDGSPTRAIDDLAAIRRQAGPVTLVVGCPRHEFEHKLRDKSLMGGVYYMVSGLDTVDDANRLMQSVRRYRT